MKTEPISWEERNEFKEHIKEVKSSVMMALTAESVVDRFDALVSIDRELDFIIDRYGDVVDNYSELVMVLNNKT